MATRVLFEVQGDPSVLAFTCPGPVTLDSLTKNFPLPGQWHFRAKVPPPVPVSQVEGYVWEDVVVAGKVPTFGGRIHLRAFPVSASAFDFPASNDLVTVKPRAFEAASDGGDDDEEDERFESRQEGARREDRPRRSSAEASGIKEATATISMFSKAFASSAKAAMEAVRKNVGN